MSRIIFNTNNFGKHLKKGFSFALAVVAAGSLAGCSDESIEVIDTPTTGIYNELDEETTAIANAVYDFEFIESTDSDEITQMYDWSETEQIVKARNKDARFLFLDGKDVETGLSNNKYGVLVCENPKEFGNYYHCIVDNEGNYFAQEIYGNVCSIDDHTIVYCKEPYNFDDETLKSTKHIIFNQITGETSEFDAFNIVTCNGIIVKSFWQLKDGISEFSYKLLNSDGVPVNNIVYDEVQIDYNHNIIYLTKDGSSEAFDVKTRQAKKIDGKVLSASNGYVVIKSNDSGSDENGVFYLENINDELAEVIPYSEGDIDILIGDKERPLFVRYVKYNNYGKFGFSYDTYFLNKNGEILATDDYSYIWDDLYCDLAIGYDVWYFDSGLLKTIDVYNVDGKKIIDNLYADSFSAIPCTELGIVRFSDEDCYGVVDFDGNCITKLKLDNLFIHPINKLQEDGSSAIVDCYLIGRNEDIKQTVVYTKEMDVVLRGDLGVFEAEEAANKDYIDKENAKKLVKGN